MMRTLGTSLPPIQYSTNLLKRNEGQVPVQLENSVRSLLSVFGPVRTSGLNELL